jgi:predicted Holliday junction resolvase-like endonuclease
VSKTSQIVDFFTLHRQIFGVCPHCREIFRLSDCHVFLKKRPVHDWMDELARMKDRLARMEERLEAEREEMAEKAREAGRRRAQRAVKRIDPIFTPRRLNPDDAKVIFHPIDYVVFDGMKGGERIRNIVLLDREGTGAEHRRLQKSIERAVVRGRYEWRTLRVREDGTVSVEA